MKKGFLKELEHRTLVLDGAMGTMIEASGAGSECNEELGLTRPEVIEGIHAAYLAAGSDIVTTNTFGASRIVLAEHGLSGKVREINLAAASVARRAADGTKGNRYVAGELGPTSKLPTLGHISFDDLEGAYLEQALALIEGGVDLVIIQTCQDPLQFKAALSACAKAFAQSGTTLPTIVSVTVERSGTMLLGTDVASALTTAAPYGPCSFGVNCATGPEDMEEHIAELSRRSPFAIVCQPNAGMPKNVRGKSVYELSPEVFSERLADYVARFGVSIVGGCCGTTPDHIAALAKSVKGAKHKKASGGEAILSSVSSLYTSFCLDQEPKPFIVAEQTNVNGSRKFKKLLIDSDYEAMVDVGRRAGEQSHALDLNLAFAGRDEGCDMSEVVSRLSKVSHVPIMVDSTSPDSMEAALRHIPGRAIINSINLEDMDKARRVLRAARRFGAAVVALTIDEEGMARTAARKVDVAKRIVELASEEGICARDLLIDALTFTLASGDPEFDGAARETLSAVSKIKMKVAGVRTLLGVSNISFGLPSGVRSMVTSAFLKRAIDAGLDAAIINPARIIPFDKIPKDALGIIDRLVDGDASKGDPLAELLSYAEGLGGAADRREARAEPKTPGEALAQKVLEGSREGLSGLVDALLIEMDPREVINTILLPAMQAVGERFGDGRLPLPFVLQSAETMRAAIDLISPHMKGKGGAARGTIVLATVRGDVHDIGKNLVDAILANNGFRVVNLGIKQPANAIVDAAKAEGADAIGLSGLLVSSTEIMREDLAVFREAGLTMPILCGGAALTKPFVDEALAKSYGSDVIYCPDAFSGLREMERICRG
jgi:5-methyltetrahydrofolate--homocysteine methyltransferase